METITNIASTATTTVSNLIYGDQTKHNETGGKEPISGVEGKGTPTDPFDQGNAPTPLETADKKAFLDSSSNSETVDKESVAVKAPGASSGGNDFLKLTPVVDGPKNEEGAPKVHTNTVDSTYTGMTIVPLNPDSATSGVDVKPTPATESTEVTDKVWKETPLDDISRSGAPGAGPSAPDLSVKPAAPGTVTTSTETYQVSAPIKPVTYEGSTVKEPTHVEQSLDGTVSPKTVTSPVVDAPKPGAVGETKGLVEEKPAHQSEPLSPSSSNEKSSKMSHIKEKLKDKLHIGSKDK